MKTPTKINLKYRENEIVRERHFSFQLSVQHANIYSPTIYTLKVNDRNGELFFSMDSNGFDVPELAKLISLFHRLGTDAVIDVLRTFDTDAITVTELIDAAYGVYAPGLMKI